MFIPVSLPPTHTTHRYTLKMMKINLKNVNVYIIWKGSHNILRKNVSYNTKVFFFFFWRRKVPRDRNTISKSMWLTCQRGVKQSRESELIRFQTLPWGFWVARQAHPKLGMLASWSWLSLCSHLIDSSAWWKLQGFWRHFLPFDVTRRKPAWPLMPKYCPLWFPETGDETGL